MKQECSKEINDNPGVFIPPPLCYVAVFVAAVFLQRQLPINKGHFAEQVSSYLGFIFVAIGMALIVVSLRQFFITKNTLITIRPALSLQTHGIYSITRNPMYLGLVNLYLAVTCFIGSWWNIILFPFLIIIVQEYIIKREERYLARRFGQDYLNYKKEVSRWI